MIDSSFMTTLPDSWAISKRFIMFPLNRWEDSYERVFLGGLTCDSDDYYNSEQHANAIYFASVQRYQTFVYRFFNTGAYQESIVGFGGVHHCLLPQPKHILIQKLKRKITIRSFQRRAKPEDVLHLLGYK